MARKKKGKVRSKVHLLKKQDPKHLLADNEWSQFEPTEVKNAPHTFVIHRGKVGRYVKELVKDFRRIMEPYTATNLKARQGNAIKDYVAVASYFHVTHLIAFRRTSLSPYMKICRVPRGPTLTFRVTNYCLARDVLSNLKKQVTYETQFQHHALLIMNNFDMDQKHLQLVSETFQNMFPTININKINLKELRRVLLVQYNAEDDTVDVRHYAVTYKPVGISKSVKKLLTGAHGKLPNLGGCEDIADFLKKEAEASESEAEEQETVEVKQKLGIRGTKGVEEVAIRLVELGPRLTLQLIKVEEGLMDGEVLYHKIVRKTDEEKFEIRRRKVDMLKIKKVRRQIQENNVKQKMLAKQQKHKRRGKYGIQNKNTKDDGMEIDEDAPHPYRKSVSADFDDDDD